MVTGFIQIVIGFVVVGFFLRFIGPPLVVRSIQPLTVKTLEPLESRR